MCQERRTAECCGVTGGGSGFAWGASGENTGSLQHGLSACCLLGNIVMEPPQAFLEQVTWLFASFTHVNFLTLMKAQLRVGTL